MTPLTAIFSTLFSLNQPYRDARALPCCTVLELIESKLDESLSYLEGDNVRRAREEVRIIKAFGSMEAFNQQAMKKKFGDIVVQ